MSLESAIGDLSNAASQLTTQVSAKMKQIDDKADAFVNDWGVNGYTTLEVGVGKAFATVSAAWSTLKGKAFKSDVLIKVFDGTYRWDSFVLENQPYADRIRIEGNVTTPANCVIAFKPSSTLFSGGWIVRGVRGLNISGFTLKGASSVDNWTSRLLRLDNSSIVDSDAGTMVFDGGARAVELLGRSTYSATNSVFKNQLEIGCIVYTSSIATLTGSVFTGLGKDASATTPSGSVYASSAAIYATDNSVVYLNGSTLSKYSRGVYAQFGAYVHMSDSIITDNNTAIFATLGANIMANNVAATSVNASFNADSRSFISATGATATGAIVGYLASFMSHITANSSKAVSCSTGYKAQVLSEIEAGTTSTASATSTVKYAPATTATLGNDNAMIRFS